MRVPFIAAAAACLALAGCQTASIDAAIQKSLPEICGAADTVHAAFMVASASGLVSQRTIDRESRAWDVMTELCADPANANTATVLIAAASAYASIAAALKEAEVDG